MLPIAQLFYHRAFKLAWVPEQNDGGTRPALPTSARHINVAVEGSGKAPMPGKKSYEYKSLRRRPVGVADLRVI